MSSNTTSTSINLALNLGKILPGGNSSESSDFEILRVERKVPKLSLSPPSKQSVLTRPKLSPRKVFLKGNNEAEFCKYKLSDETGEAKVAIKKLKGKPPLQSRTPRDRVSSSLLKARNSAGAAQSNEIRTSEKATEGRTLQRFSFDIQTEDKISRTEPIGLWGAFDDKDSSQLALMKQSVSQVVGDSDSADHVVNGIGDIKKDIGIIKLVREADASTINDTSRDNWTNEGADAKETEKQTGFALGLPEMDPTVLGTKSDSPVVYKGWNRMSLPEQKGIQGYGRALVLKSFQAKEFDFGNALDDHRENARALNPTTAATADIEYLKSSATADRQQHLYKGKATRELAQTQVLLKTESGSPGGKGQVGLKGNKLRPQQSDPPYSSAAPHATAILKPVMPGGTHHWSASPRVMLRRGELRSGLGDASGFGVSSMYAEQANGVNSGAESHRSDTAFIANVQLGQRVMKTADADQASRESAMSPNDPLAYESSTPTVAVGKATDYTTAQKSSFFRAILRADRYSTVDTDHYVDIHYPDSLSAGLDVVTRAVPGFTRDPPRETLVNPDVGTSEAYRAILKGADALAGAGEDHEGYGERGDIEEPEGYGERGDIEEGAGGPLSMLKEVKSGVPLEELPDLPAAEPSWASDVPEDDPSSAPDCGNTEGFTSEAGFTQRANHEDPEDEARVGSISASARGGKAVPRSVKVPASGVVMKKVVQAVASFTAEHAVTDSLVNFLSIDRSNQEKGPNTKQDAQLTLLEKREYTAFPSAMRCFYGCLEAKMKTELFVGLNNHGYDDSEGNYQVKAGDHLAYRYEVRGLLGWGSFGAVYSCWDHYKHHNCAVKICRNKASIRKQVDAELETLLLLRSQAKNLSRRMSIMRLSNHNESESCNSVTTGSRGGAVATAPLLKEHAVATEGPQESPTVEIGQAHNCVTILESFLFRKHRCLVFQSFGINLYEYLKSVNFQGMGLGQVRKVALQLLKALKHLKALGIVHYDIKPENVLLKGDPKGSDDNGMEVVLCDFGSASFVGESPPSYVQSRYYRAPEVVLRLRNNQKDGSSVPIADSPAYSFEVDMWSLAAMLPELRTGNVCFPAESEEDLFACHCEVLGMPSSSLLERVDPLVSQELVQVDTEIHGAYTLRETLRISPHGNYRSVGARSISRLARARKTDASFVDFLTRGLSWDPQERLTVEEALDHDWITKINLHQHRAPGAARRSPIVGDASG